MNSSLNSITSAASSGLRASQAAIAVVSDNIANAGVAGYTAKRLDSSAFEAGGQLNGVRIGLVSRSVDAAVQTSVWSAASRVGQLQVRSQVLQSVNALQGTPGDGTSLADAVSGLQNSFTALQSQPSNQAQQAAVVAAAGTLARSVNSTADGIATQRNAVQAQVAISVDSVNAALETVQSTTRDIIQATGSNTDTGALQDQRDAALQTLSTQLDLHYDKQPGGGITLLGSNGFSLPLDSRLSTASTSLSAGGSPPPILLQYANSSAAPTDVTKQLSGGQLGELVQLRDSTLPSYTASLDAFAAKLSDKFSGQGLDLFTAGGTTTGVGNTPGAASAIQVNPAVQAKPSLVRDGTSSAIYPVNPASGPAGFSALINRVVGSTFAASGAGTSITADAQAFVSQQSTASSQADADLAGATSYQTTVATRFADGSGVDVDHELGLMIQLQNSYQANARVMQATQSMFNALLDATRAV